MLPSQSQSKNGRKSIKPQREHEINQKPFPLPQKGGEVQNVCSERKSRSFRSDNNSQRIIAGKERSRQARYYCPLLSLGRVTINSVGKVRGMQDLIRFDIPRNT